MKNNKYLEYFDNYREVYRKPEGFFDGLAGQIAELMAGKKEISILDIGCGFGDFLDSLQKILEERGKYYGLTIAKHEYDDIIQKKKFIDIKIGKEQDILKLFKGVKFDIIINFHTLSYIPQDQQKEVASCMDKCLKGAGVMVLGLIDDWIKISDKISQNGEGYVQFFYSPSIFGKLRNYRLLFSSNRNMNKYRIQIWKKGEGGAANYYLPLFYIIKNNILFAPFLKKAARKILKLIK